VTDRFHNLAPIELAMLFGDSDECPPLLRMKRDAGLEQLRAERVKMDEKDMEQRRHRLGRVA
jgi:hypothetical protein